MVGIIGFILVLLLLYASTTPSGGKNKGGGSSTFFVGGPDSSHGHHLSGGDSFGDGDGGGGDCGGLSPSSAPARIFRLDAVLLQSAGHVPAISLHTFSIYSKQSIQLFNRTSDWE
ncbi:hypothetical protein BSONL12_18329 [Bacillus sonorensis L12]|uniref:Uncharacterized protein n=2 Tax=Bacillus sonorensis TaxID=119858 RepID=M5PCB4_9BACI|nr:hypothetical protein BSONL12_18329 [Bacillus sonorensis L12]